MSNKMYYKYTVSVNANIKGNLHRYTKGDTYVYDVNTAMYVCRKETDDMVSVHSISPDMMATIADLGIVYPDLSAQTRSSEIDRLLDLYNKDINECVEEGDELGVNVLSNLIKVLNHLKRF